jgi:16S rRNA (guanine(1405)-N(7))-methyltransferase
MSGKYNMLYAPLVERIFAEESGKKDPVKAAKTRLHQLYGAYKQGHTHKKAHEALKTLGSPAFDQNDYLPKITKILALHASTKERQPHLAEFYDFIFSHTNPPQSVLDLGCGFNPFALHSMPTESLKIYRAYDIDLRLKDLLNQFFALSDLPPAAECADLTTETPPHPADIAFMLKLLPVLEAQKAGRGFELANALNARFLVITYPLKSLGGREKGMEKTYSHAFESAAHLLPNFRQVACEKIGNELVYILKTVGLPAPLPRETFEKVSSKL